MGEPTPEQILVQDPLSQVTRSERRSLLGVSAITIIIVKTGLIPTKISALGIEFSATDRSALLGMMGLVVTYFLVAFLVYAISDFVDWRLKFSAAIGHMKREFRDRVREGYQDTADDYPEPKVRGLVLPMSLVRAILEFVLPIVIGIYAAAVSFSASA